MSSPRQQGKGPKRELQGTRPAPLKISRDSHNIRKPQLPLPAMQNRQPVIIYTYSPQVIHTEAREFMTLVQRLTGRTGRVNAEGHSSMHSSSSSSFSFQSQTCQALPHNSHTSVPENPNISYHQSQTWNALPHKSQTSVPGNPNIDQVDASPSPARGGGLDFLVKEYNNSIVSAGSNPSDFSGNIIRSQYSAPVQSLISPSIQYGSMSPFSPNFFQLPSPRLLSPNIFKEFPLCTPSSQQPDYLYSPYRHLLRMESEPIFSPPVRPAMNAFSSLPSPPSTDCDLFNNNHQNY